MSQVRTSWSAVICLGIGTLTLGLYFFVNSVSPLLAGVGIIVGLWAIGRRGGRIIGYTFAALGIFLGALQFVPFFFQEELATYTKIGTTVNT
jgi:hypothetical protein